MKFGVVASNAGEYADPKLLVQLAREAKSASATWCRCELRVSFDLLSEARKFLRTGPLGNIG